MINTARPTICVVVRGSRDSARISLRKNGVAPNAELSVMINVICIVKASNDHSPCEYASRTLAGVLPSASAIPASTSMKMIAAVIASGTRRPIARAKRSCQPAGAAAAVSTSSRV